MRNLPLNQSRVDRLKPENSTCDTRDTDLKGFGIRVMPSGKKSYFLQTQYDGKRRWTKIGDADAMPEAEDRVPARGVRALRSTRLPAGRAGTFRLPRWAA